MAYLILLYVTIIILLCISYNITGKDILRPINVMLAVFLLSTTFTLLNGINWKINYSLKSYFVLASGLIVALVADYIFYLRFGFKKSRNIQQKRNIKPIIVKKWKIILISIIELGILFLYYKEIKRLAILDGYTSGANLLWHFRNITSYTGEESLNGLVSILIKMIDSIAYIIGFIIINNILSEKINLKRIYIYFLPIILFAVKVLIGSGRQELLRFAAFSICTSYILYKFKVGWEKNITLKYLKKFIVLIPIALLLFYYATNIIGRGTSRTIFQYISTYVGGSIQHFNQFMEDPIQLEHFGEETFPGVYSLFYKLGITNYTRIVHLEMRKLGITQGNVYTFFRRPYNDFGYFGMIFLTFIIIGAFSRSYSKMKYDDDSYNNDYSIIVYSYLFYWVVLSSVEQYSIGIVSIGTIITLLLMRFFYFFFVQLELKKSKIIIKFNKLDEEVK